MANDPQSSDKVDPLFDFLGISLCTRTLVVSKNALKPNDNDDLESLHVFMQSMALKSPKKHLEHAKEIVYRSTQPPNSEFASFVTSNNENEAVASNGKQTLPGRRPGLARKRPRFSMKPNLSQPSARSVSSLDIKQLDDPVEFFLAHERLENAEKELRRLRGESMSDLNDFKPRPERHRRPGLSGRSVSYKHLYPSILTEKDYATVPSEESLGEGILSPNYSSQPETVNSHVELQEQDLTGSIAATGNKGSALFDELLSDSCENLDGDEMKCFLQERLQIKPLHLENLRLPDFHDLEKSELADLGKKLPKPRTSLLDRQNLEKGVSGEAPVKHKQVAKSPFRSLASPTSPNYLFASVSALKKRILQSNLLKDPVSALDLPPARSSSSLGDDNEPSNQLDIRNELIDSPSGSLTSLIPQVDDVRPDNMGLSELITSEVDTNVGPIASHNDIRDSNRNESMAIRDSDAALSDVQNLVKGVSSEAIVKHKQVSKSPSWSLASPTPPKSPFASICALKKHILRSNLSKDPFSALDLSPARNSSSLRDDDEPSNRFNIRKGFMDCSSSGLTPLIPEVDEVFTNGGPVASHDDIRDSNHSSSMGIGDTNVDFRADATTAMEKNASVSGHVVDEQFDVSEYLDANAHFYDKMQVGDVLQQAKQSRQVDGNVESSSWHHTDFQTAKSNESEENLQDENMSPNAEPPMNIDSTAQRTKKKDHLTVGPANIPDCIPMQHIQNIQEPVEVSPDEQSKAQRPLGNGRKRKEVSRRQSLAAAGTYMESGVRRSRRIKMRPLEYWKGERFLYGRIHESLTTVIGVKYVSPAKGAEKSYFRVKSYVSDEYKELVDLAALH